MLRFIYRCWLAGLSYRRHNTCVEVHTYIDVGYSGLRPILTVVIIGIPNSKNYFGIIKDRALWTVTKNLRLIKFCGLCGHAKYLFIFDTKFVFNIVFCFIVLFFCMFNVYCEKGIQYFFFIIVKKVLLINEINLQSRVNIYKEEFFIIFFYHS